MSLKLTEKNVVLGLETVSKEEAIRKAGEFLVELGAVENDYIDAMIEREKLMTTYMGMGLAIPHGINDAKKHIKESNIVICQYPEGVDFDGEKAYLVIGIAGKGDEHLEILSAIAVAADDELIASLSKSNDKNEFINAFEL